VRSVGQWAAIIVLTLLWAVLVYVAAVFLIFHIEWIWLKVILVGRL
jgi:hypothetical protein